MSVFFVKAMSMFRFALGINIVVINVLFHDDFHKTLNCSITQDIMNICFKRGAILISEIDNVQSDCSTTGP